MKIRNLAIIAACATMFAGCEPDKITVEVPVSAIAAARAGKVAYVKANAIGSSEMGGSDISAKKDRIRNAVERRLGKGGKFSIRNTDSSGVAYSAKWRVPVYRQGSAPDDATDYPFCLVLAKDGVNLILLTNKDKISAMDSALSDIDFSLGASVLCSTDITFENDTDEDFSYTVHGAFVDGNAKVCWRQKLEPGDESTASFGRKPPESVWHELSPMVEVLFAE